MLAVNQMQQPPARSHTPTAPPPAGRCPGPRPPRPPRRHTRPGRVLPKVTPGVLQQPDGAVGDHHPAQRAVLVLLRRARPVHLEHRAGGIDDALQGREHVPGIRQARAQLPQAVGEGVPVSQRVIPLSHRWLTAPPHAASVAGRAPLQPSEPTTTAVRPTRPTPSAATPQRPPTPALSSPKPRPYDDSTLPAADEATASPNAVWFAALTW
jgi:hypothetical protein